jgi:hypothetical protein
MKRTRTESDIKIKWNQIIRNKIEEINQSKKIHKIIAIKKIKIKLDIKNK